MKLKDRLAALRQERGLSQADVAEALNVSRQAISGWERGANIPSAENLICLSQLYGIPLDYLLNGSEHRPVEVAAESGAAGKGRWSRKVIGVVAAVVCVLALGILFIFLSAHQGDGDRISIGTLQKEPGAEVSSTGGFDVEW